MARVLPRVAAIRSHSSLSTASRGSARQAVSRRKWRARLEFRGQRPGGDLPYIPVTDQAPAGRSHEAKRVELRFELTGARGAVFDNLRACAREKTGEFFLFRADRDASQATVSQITGQL